MSRRSVEQWRREVYRSHRLGDAARVLLLYLADHMSTDRKVSVPRATIAKALNRSERRVSERVSAAHEAGFLSTVSAGHRGHVPVYQGLFPSAERETATSTLSSRQSVTLSTLERETHGGPTTTRADLTARVTDRDVGNDEETEDRPARSGLLVCDCHGLADCSSLGPNREAIA